MDLIYNHTSTWLSVILIMLPFCLLIAFEIFYRVYREEGLDYEYTYNEEDFNDDEPDTYDNFHLREEP